MATFWFLLLTALCAILLDLFVLFCRRKNQLFFFSFDYLTGVEENNERIAIWKTESPRSDDENTYRCGGVVNTF